MHLEHESLLAFPGLNGMQGICHIRAYEAPGYRAVVIAGELSDNPGTFIPNAIEMLAYAIQTELYPDGGEFQLVQHRPRDEFLAVDFQHRSVDEDPRRLGAPGIGHDHHHPGRAAAHDPRTEEARRLP